MLHVSGGYYSASIKPGLKLIILNTILWLRANTLSEDLEDPAQQMMWLAKELQESQDSDEKVYVVSLFRIFNERPNTRGVESEAEAMFGGVFESATM